MKQEKIRIIIADDHYMIRETWKLVLEQDERFIVVEECANGEEVILAAKTHVPDIILMDVNMKPVNGFEATRKILKNDPSMKIIGVSMNNQATYAKNMLQLGAKGYVTKNCKKEEMIEGILEVYKGRQFICSEIKNKMENGKTDQFVTL